MSIHDSKTMAPDGPLTVRTATGGSAAREVSLTLSDAFRKRFSVGRLLGEGGMGAVYHAVRLENGEEVALKFLILGGDSDSLLRFMQEGDLLGRIAHPHVLAIHEMGIEGACPYLVCEYLAGGTLSARLRQGPLPPADVARIGAELYEGLSAIHAAGVVHRDLKPSNVMFTADGFARVTDLGVSRLAESAEKLTRTGAFVGTPAYFSPEQSCGRPATPASDVYAAGLILHEMACGSGPFVSDDFRALLKMQVEDLPPTLSDLVPGFPPELSDLVLHTLEKHPADRPASAAEVADRLRAIEAALPRAARPIGATSAASVETDRPTPPTRARSRGTARPSSLAQRSGPTPVPSGGPRSRASSIASPSSFVPPARRWMLAGALFVLMGAVLGAARWRVNHQTRVVPSATPASPDSSPAAPRGGVWLTLGSRAGCVDALPRPPRLRLAPNALPSTARVAAIPGLRARAMRHALTRADLALVRAQAHLDFGTSPASLGHFIELDDFLEGRGPRPRRLPSDQGDSLNAVDEAIWIRALEGAAHEDFAGQLVHVVRVVAANSADSRGWYALGALYLAEGRPFAGRRALSVARGLAFQCGRFRGPRLVAEGIFASLEDAGELDHRWGALLGCDNVAPGMLAAAALLFAEPAPGRLEQLAQAGLSIPPAAPAAQALFVDLELARGQPDRARDLLAQRTLTSSWPDATVARRMRLELSRGHGAEADQIQGGIGSRGGPPVDVFGTWAYRLCWPADPQARPEGMAFGGPTSWSPTMELPHYEDAPLLAMEAARFLECGDLAAAEKILAHEEVQPPLCWPWERLELAALMAGSKDAALAERVRAALAEPMSPERVLLVSELTGHETRQRQRAQPLLDAFAAAHSGTPWPLFVSALIASRHGDHAAALDLLRSALAADTRRELPYELTLEIVFRPVWDQALVGKTSACDDALLDAVWTAPLAGAPAHVLRVAAYVRAMRQHDLDAACEAAVVLFDDDPVAPLWQASLLFAAALRHDQAAFDARERQLRAVARWWACDLWGMPRVTGYRPR